MDMDRALSGYEILVHVAKHSDAIITYADTLTVSSTYLTAARTAKLNRCPRCAVDSADSMILSHQQQAHALGRFTAFSSQTPFSWTLQERPLIWDVLDAGFRTSWRGMGRRSLRRPTRCQRAL